MRERAAISGYATLDFIVRSPEPPKGARTYAAEILGGAAWPRAGGAALYAGRRLAAAGVVASPLVSIGADANGWAYRETCLKDGLSVEAIDMHEGRTPACILVHHAAGGCTCYLDPGAVTERLTELQVQAIERATLVCIAAAPPSLSQDVLERVAPHQTLAWIAKADEKSFPSALCRRIAARADVIFCNAGERAMVDAARKAAPSGQLLIETRGPDGVLVEGPGAPVLYSVTPTRVQDATGAGDTFAGEFLASRLLGANEADCVAAANEAARALLLSRL